METDKDANPSWFLRILVYVLFFLGSVMVGYVAGGQENRVAPDAVALQARILTLEKNLETANLLITGKDDIFRDPTPGEVKALLDRYRESAGRSAAKWEDANGRLLTGQEAYVLTWLVQKTEHPCPMPRRFLLAHTDAIMELSRTFDVEVDTTKRQ